LRASKKIYVIVVLVNKGYKNNCFATFCKTQAPIFLKGKKIETTLPSSKEERNVN
jgi:hypothetical protein